MLQHDLLTDFIVNIEGYVMFDKSMNLFPPTGSEQITRWYWKTADADIMDISQVITFSGRAITRA